MANSTISHTKCIIRMWPHNWSTALKRNSITPLTQWYPTPNACDHTIEAVYKKNSIILLAQSHPTPNACGHMIENVHKKNQQA